MDLPPEVRNHIYSYLFVSNASIRIERVKNGGTQRTPKSSQYLPKRDYTIKAKIEGWYGRQQREKTSLITCHSLAILQANKFIHEEAKQIFYGANSFTFASVPAVFEFKIRSGRNFAFLKDIKILHACFLRGGAELQRSLYALRAPTRVEFELHVTDKTNASLDDIARWLWYNYVEPFVKNSGTWQADKDKIDTDAYAERIKNTS